LNKLVVDKLPDPGIGVIFISDDSSDEFEKAYLKVRAQEKRLLDDMQVAQLPVTDVDNLHYREWKMRQHSTNLVLEHIKQSPLTGLDWFLDIGCGNGWFSGLLAKETAANVLAIDINKVELEQAQRVFQQPNLYFAYLDLLANPPKNKQFSMIFLNSCFQYFENPKALLDLCLSLLIQGGEIHIIDSPFYAPDEVLAAKVRSDDYYQGLGVGEVGQFYHHQSLALLEGYNVRWMYQPAPKAIRSPNDSPFAWVKISQ